MKSEYSLTHKISMYIYVTPGYPLTVSVYLAPTKAEHSKDKLLEVGNIFISKFPDSSYVSYLYTIDHPKLSPFRTVWNSGSVEIFIMTLPMSMTAAVGYVVRDKKSFWLMIQSSSFYIHCLVLVYEML